jgi:outer membrane protein assembly factor BamA
VYVYDVRSRKSVRKPFSESERDRQEIFGRSDRDAVRSGERTPCVNRRRYNAPEVVLFSCLADNLASLSTEIRIPVNSPLSVGRFGVKGFVDVGTTWHAGQRLRAQTFDRGVGGGIYFGGGPVIADMAVARSRQGRYRFHFGLGLNL